MKGRIPTHIPGMDELINGGFPEGTINLLTGPPGSAKSLFGMHYIYNGARYEDEPGIYLTLEESRNSILRAATSYGLDIETFEKEGKSYLIDLGKMRVECSSAEELEWLLLEPCSFLCLTTAKTTKILLSFTVLALPTICVTRKRLRNGKRAPT